MSESRINQTFLWRGPVRAGLCATGPGLLPWRRPIGGGMLVGPMSMEETTPSVSIMGKFQFLKLTVS